MSPRSEDPLLFYVRFSCLFSPSTHLILVLDLPPTTRYCSFLGGTCSNKKALLKFKPGE